MSQPQRYTAKTTVATITTTVVLVATIVFAVYLWGCDLLFYKAIDFLFTKFGSGT